MSREEKLRKAARAAAHDDSIVDVAEFMPLEIAEDVALSTKQDKEVAVDVSGAPETVEAGARLGPDLAAHRAELPPHVCLAVSPDRVHVLGLPHGFFAARPEQAYLMGSFDRDALEVEVKGRLADLVLMLTDRDSGAVIRLVADRLSGYHPTTLIELLRMSAAHRPEERG